MDPWLLGTATAFGLAASAGLNTTLPLLIVGLLARFSFLTLAAPYDALSSDIALGGLALFALVEFAGDKFPGLDSVLQTVQWPLAAAAGAILFASQSSVVSAVSPGLAVLVGLLTAGAIHAARAVTRPAVTGLSFLHMGTGNAAVSLLEDGFAILLAIVTIISPLASLVLVLVLVVVLLFASIWSLRHGVRLSRLLRRRLASGAVPAIRRTPDLN